MVFWAAASEPASGSDRAKQPSFWPEASAGSQACFWASLPNFRIGSHTSELFTDMMTAVEAQARAISSRATTYETVSMPAPPQLSGTATPISPSSPSRAINSLGKRCSLSIAAARGAISLLARSRAVSRSRACSGVSSRSTIPEL